MIGCQKTQEQYVEDAKALHGEKYSYERTKYVRSKDKLIVTCRVHGDFEITANHHLRGRGCKCCAVEANSSSKILGREVFLVNASLKHGDLYDYSKTFVTTLKNKVSIICRTHGEFITTPGNHLKGSHCPLCARESQANSQVNSLDEFLAACYSTHENKYDYSLIDEYKGAKSKVRIVCALHGEFSQIAGNHYGGADCPICKPGGYNTTLAGSFYILTDGSVTKVGITNKPTKVRADYISSKSSLDFKIATEIYCVDGALPPQIERKALSWLRENYSGIESKFNGSTECFMNVPIGTLLNYLSPYLTGTA